jgi:PhzF family phenazine biosynthesis protein
MPIPIFHVDAFTDRAFEGNPAAVCLLKAWPDVRWLQLVAREMNLSETAFLVRKAEGFDLRWFTPMTEVDLCGHATLAPAHVLWQQGLVNPNESIRFSTRSGLLTATRNSDEILLDFPIKSESPSEPPVGLLDSLGASAKYIGKNQFDYLVELESEGILRGLTPDFRSLAKVEARGVIVTCRSDDSRFDFVSRFFAPAVGVDEDPVTGSSHCCLADFWKKQLGKTNFLAYQASSRGGVVRVQVKNERVILSGKAVIITKGELVVDTTCPDATR